MYVCVCDVLPPRDVPVQRAVLPLRAVPVQRAKLPPRAVVVAAFSEPPSEPSKHLEYVPLRRWWMALVNKVSP